MLLTGDAGVPALGQAGDYLEGQGIAFQQFSFVQTPHHGSKRNVGQSILNRLIGEPVLINSKPHLTFFVSACKEENPKHPNKRVANALIRRGGKVIITIMACSSEELPAANEVLASFYN